MKVNPYTYEIDACVVKSMKYKRERVEVLKADMKKSETSVGDFYKDKNMVGVAKSVAIIAAMVLGFAAAIAASVAIAVFSANPAGCMVIPLIIALPLLGLIPLRQAREDSSRTLEKDQQTVRALEKEIEDFEHFEGACREEKRRLEAALEQGATSSPKTEREQVAAQLLDAQLVKSLRVIEEKLARFSAVAR